MSALLSGGKRPKQKDEPIEPEYTPETVFPDAESSVSHPIEYVNELTREEIDEMERSYAQANAPVAATVPLEYEPEEEAEAEPMVIYPERVEIEVDDTAPLAESDSPEQTQDYQGGFDYSLESAEDAEQDEVTTIGGVAVKVEKLSDEERETVERILGVDPA
jgi:hypothetical protein